MKRFKNPEEEIFSVFSEVLGIPRGKLSEKTKLDTIIEDSLHFIEIVATLSKKFKARVKPSDISRFRTIGDIIAYAKKKQ